MGKHKILYAKEDLPRDNIHYAQGCKHHLSLGMQFLPSAAAALAVLLFHTNCIFILVHTEVLEPDPTMQTLQKFKNK